MPTFLAAVIAAAIPATTAIAFAGLTWAAVIANGALLIGGLVLSSSQRKKAKEQAREQANAAQVDRFATVVSSVMTRELVLGRVRKGGSVFFRGSTGEYKSTFLMGQALAGHLCDGIEQVYLGDQAVTLDGEGNVLDEPYNQMRKVPTSKPWPGFDLSVELDYDPVPGSVGVWIVAAPDSGNSDMPISFSLSGRTVTITEDPAVLINGPVVLYQRYETNSMVRVWWELGDPNAPADARAMELFPSLWTAAHRGIGVAKLWTEFKYNENAFPNGLPLVTVRMRGAHVYDPRTSLTVFSENPALHLRHVYQHASFGKASATAAEDARVIAAANACDTSTNYVVSGVTTTRALYTSAIVAPYGAAARDLFDDLAQAMGGLWAYAGGELYMRAGVFTASVRSFTGADFAVITRTGESERQNPISITPHRERARKVNTVDLRIWDAAQDYKMAPITPVSSPALVARDGGKALTDGEMVLPAVTFAPQAQHIAGILLRDGRDPMIVRLPFKLRAYAIEVFDTISLTRPRNGWVSKLFMVMAREWDASNGVVWLTLKETTAAIFTPDAAFLPQGYASNSALPKPWDIHPPVLSASRIYSGTNELVPQAGGGWLEVVRVTWDALLDQSIVRAGQIEIEWVRVGSSGGAIVSVEGAATEVRLIGPTGGTAILVRARSRNSVAVSDWSVQVSHPVLGKTQAPSDVMGVSAAQDRVFFNLVSDKDVVAGGGYEVRAVPGDVGQWALGTPLQQGLTSASPFFYPQPLYGIQTVMVAAVDSSGNAGVHGSSTVDFGTPDLLNIVDAYDFRAADWPGFIANGTISAGDIVADANPAVDFWAIGGEDFWVRDNAADFWGGDDYLPMTYQFTYVPPYSGGTLTLEREAVGSRITLQYRIDGGTLGDFWVGPAGDPLDFWGGTDDFWGGYEAWATWPEAVTTVAARGITWLLTVDGGPQQGGVQLGIASLSMLDAPQRFTAIAVAPGGTYCDPALGTPPREWITLETAQVTPKNEPGSTAVTGRVLSYDLALGPRIELLDATGTPTSGVAIVNIIGTSES
ncbi:MAG: phage tail protein [Pseudomonadota bacterium]